MKTAFLTKKLIKHSAWISIGVLVVVLIGMMPFGITLAAAPSTPSSFVVSRYCDASVIGARLTWNASSGAVGYEISRSGTQNGTYTVLGTVATTQYIDSAVAAGQAYYYKVRAYNSSNEYSGYTSPRGTTIPSGCLGGWSWSDNIGWTSMSSTTDGAQLRNYGLLINTSNGNLGGQVWSDNVGWITFDSTRFGSCPPNISSQCEPKLTGTTLSGFARACSVFASNCTGTLLNNGGLDTYRGGWDGWINLNGVSLNGTSFSGYAWGGNVVGWIDMSGVFFNRPYTLPNAPGVPIGIASCESVDGSTAKIELGFDAGSGGTAPYTYNVYRKLNNPPGVSDFLINISSSLTYTDAGLDLGEKYYYAVQTVDSGGFTSTLQPSSLIETPNNCDVQDDNGSVEKTTFKAVPQYINLDPVTGTGSCSLLTTVIDASEFTVCRITANGFDSRELTSSIKSGVGTWKFTTTDSTVNAERRYTLTCGQKQNGEYTDTPITRYASCLINPSYKERN